MQKLRPFHLAIPVDCIEKAKNFYGNLLGFNEGRSSENWVDYNFFWSPISLPYWRCAKKSK